MAKEEFNDHLFGLVDMGSNGIRFSITDLSPPTTRSLPTLFTSRLGLSLYDAQFREGSSERQPIPAKVITSVIDALRSFKTTCADFGVKDPENVTILATEATRTAVNAKAFLEEIKEKTGGWEVKLLAKEDEGRVGAMGVASSDETMKGLVMDLGGGSTQITWLVSKNGEVQTSPAGSFSFPYGAAAMMRRLSDIDRSSNPSSERSKLSEEMKANFRSAYQSLNLPSELVTPHRDAGLTLYLSGGGFRGWGYLLMSQSQFSPYPIPIINGYRVPVSEFKNTTHLQSIAAASLEPSTSSTSSFSSSEKIFRVSKRRATQVPAVAFLVDELISAIPNITTIQFCQGGVREGYLFSYHLSPELRAESPLVSATKSYATKVSKDIFALLNSSLPSYSPDRHLTNANFLPTSISPSLISALSQTMYIHTPHPKETAPLSALHFPITGPLSAVHGLSHTSRALLSLMLLERWSPGSSSSDLPVPNSQLQTNLENILHPLEVWWSRYLGRIASILGDVYPSGNTFLGFGKGKLHRIDFMSEYKYIHKKKHSVPGVQITVILPEAAGRGEAASEAEASITEPDEEINEEQEDIEKGQAGQIQSLLLKLGKKKRWIRGEGLGLEVEVRYVDENQVLIKKW